MPLFRPGLPPVFHPGERRGKAPAPAGPAPLPSVDAAKAAAAARHAASQPAAPAAPAAPANIMLPSSDPPLKPVPLPTPNPTPQSEPDEPPGTPPATLPQPGDPPVLGQPAAGSPATTATGAFVGAAVADTTNAQDQQASILSQDEQNMVQSLDPAEILHLEAMLALAKKQGQEQTAQPTVEGEPEKAPQVNSKGEAPHAINDHDSLLK